MLKTSCLIRTLHTTSHLKPGQVGYRLWRRVAARLPRRKILVPARIELRDDLPQPLCDAPAQPDEPAAAGGAEPWLKQIEQGVFSHLNQAEQLAQADRRIDWRLGPVTQHRLWTVTLHYHAWADRLAECVVSQDAAIAQRADRALRRYLADWIERCDLDRPGARHLAWNAYAVATRIGNWVRLYHRLGPRGRASWGDLDPAFLQSLYKQAAFLASNLEWDLRGNHLMRDALGLAWAGRFFAGPQPRRWLATATRLACQQAREQVLPDGGHFERSPMYHLQIMNDLAIAATLIEDEPARRQLHDTWLSMAEFAAWLRHPDRQIPLLNDAASNGAASPDDTLRHGGALLDHQIDLTPRRGTRHFEDFGLAVHHGPTWSLFFDVGPVGVDYQPGHAHADTLSFEASFHGRRLVVDPGVFAYDLDDRRRHDRATASHNTVCIDDTNSSDVWHIFRVGRRAYPRDVVVTDDADGFRAAASHTGYRHLPGRPAHRRELSVTPDHHLRITDHITGNGEHTAQGSLLIAPGWSIEPIALNAWQLHADGNRVTISFDSDEPLTCENQPAVYHPEFGVELPTRRLTWRYHGRLPLRVQTVIAELTSPRSPGIESLGHAAAPSSFIEKGGRA